jgi:Ni/Co efflux regulator RcnB
MRIGLFLTALAVLANAATVLPTHAAADEKSPPLSCDGSIAANFKPSAETKALVVKHQHPNDVPQPDSQQRGALTPKNWRDDGSQVNRYQRQLSR